MALESNSPNEDDGQRRPPRPQKNVDPEKSINMAESFDVFSDDLRSLTATMRNMERTFKTSLDALAQFSVDKNKAEGYREAGESLADHPSSPYDPTTGVSRQAINAITWRQHHEINETQPSGQSLGPSFDYFVDPGDRLSGIEGTQSLSHFQTWAAQRIGAKVAGHEDTLDPSLRGDKGNRHPRPGWPIVERNQEPERMAQEASHTTEAEDIRESMPEPEPAPEGDTSTDTEARRDEQRQSDPRAGSDTAQDLSERVEPSETPTPPASQAPSPFREREGGPAQGSTTSDGDEEEGPRHARTEPYVPKHARSPKHRLADAHRADSTDDPNAGQVTSGDGSGGAGEPPEGGGEGAAAGEPEEGGAPSTVGLGTAGGVAAARTRIGSAIAQSGGTAAGLRAALTRIPVAGLGIDVAQKGAEVYQDQREQARSYQGMTGSTGAEGWQDKRQEDMHRWSNFFKYSGEQAREQFQTATAAGYNDRQTEGGRIGSREQALDFMDSTYHNVGMTTQESGQMADMANRNTFTNLDELSTTLQRLSESAGEAGINTEKARQNFAGFFESITNMGMGSSAQTGAAMLTQTQTNYGKQFEDVDMSGAFSPDMQIMAGAMSGMNYGEMQGMARNDPTAYGQVMSGTYREIFKQIDPELATAAEELAAGADLSDENEVQRIRDELIGEGAPFADHDLNTKAQAFSGLAGVEVNPEQYVTMMIQEMGGHGMAQAAEQEKQAEQAKKGGSAGDVAAGGGSSVTKELQNQGEDKFGSSYFFPKSNNPLQGLSNEEAGAKLDEMYSEDYEDTSGPLQISEKEEYEAASALEMSEWGQEGRSLAEGAWGGIVKDFTRGQAAEDQYMTGASNQYYEKFTKEGKNDPFLEALLQNTSDHRNSKVKIPIAGGGERVVSLDEAMQHYSSQLASGEVEFVEGEAAGSTTGDVAGMEGSGELKDAGDENTTQENLDELGVGQSLEEWEKDNPDAKGGKDDDKKGGDSEKVVIDLTPEAAQLFRIHNGEGDPAAAHGTPPDMEGSINQRGGRNFPR